MAPRSDHELIEISAPVPPRRLSHDLRDLLAHASGRSLSLAEIESVLKTRGFALLILILALPFALPVTLPGLSLVFGIVIFAMGARIAMGQKPWLPQFVLKKEISYPVLKKMVTIGLKLFTRVEKIVRPRMHFLQRWPGMMNLIGVGIASGGLLLCLPLPPFIPLSNTIPGWSVMLLAAGLIERDGLLVLLGYLVNIAAWIYFLTLFFLSERGVRHLLEYFS